MDEVIRHNYLLSKGYVVYIDDDQSIVYYHDIYDEHIYLYKSTHDYNIGEIGNYNYKFGDMVIRLGYEYLEYIKYHLKYEKLYKRSNTIKNILNEHRT